MKELNIADLAQGALNEQVIDELKRVFENIMDPNTDPTKKRTVTIKMVITPISENRDLVNVEMQAKSSVCPYNSITTNMCIGKRSGDVIAEEYVPGTMAGQARIALGTGEILNDNTKVVGINRGNG